MKKEHDLILCEKCHTMKWIKYNQSICDRCLKVAKENNLK